MFVHGSYSSAWIWDRHFLPFFAEHGFEAYALSLRGHGASEGRENLPFFRLRDYVDDLEQVVRDLPRPPVLIGHSMGGMVVQKLMHQQNFPATVLMAPVPPHGLLGSVFEIALTNPKFYQELVWAQTFGPSAFTHSAVRRALFSDKTPEIEVVHCFDRFQPESMMVILDLIGFDLPPSRPMLDLPVLVLGASNDGFVFPGALEATATTYRTRPEIIPDLAHAMMLDDGWERVAGRILVWLGETLES